MRPLRQHKSRQCCSFHNKLAHIKYVFHRLRRDALAAHAVYTSETAEMLEEQRDTAAAKRYNSECLQLFVFMDQFLF